MRRAAALLILQIACGGSSCGPSRPDPSFPRYVIVTTLPEEGPDDFVSWLSRRRAATDVLRFRSLDRDAEALRDGLLAAAPAYVAVVIRAEELDANFHLSFLELACGLDADPFPDFAFGYLVSGPEGLLERQKQTILGVDRKIEPRLLRATHLSLGAAESAAGVERLNWATGLPLRRLQMKEGDLGFLRQNLPAVERCDYLVLHGEPSPGGIRGLPLHEVRLLRLDSSAVFSGVPGSGAISASFDLEAGRVKRRPLVSDQTFISTMLRNGAAAVFAPLQGTRPGTAEREWTDALLTDAPLGDSVRHTYERAILAAGGRAERFGRFVEGQGPPGVLASPMSGALRVLYGDPWLRPFSRDSTNPARLVMSRESTHPDGRLLIEANWHVAAYDCSGFFTDPQGDGHLIHLHVPCRRGLRASSVVTLRCEAQGREIPARVSALAPEEDREWAQIHVLLAGKDLAREDMTISLRLAIE